MTSGDVTPGERRGRGAAARPRSAQG